MKKKKAGQILSIVLISSLIIGTMTGCGNSDSSSADVSSESTSVEEAAASEDAVAAAAAKYNRDENGNYTGKLTETPVTFTAFCGNGTGNFTTGTFSESLIDNNQAIQKIFENTGVTIDFITPASGEEDSQFNLMIASGNYPDIIIGDTSTTYPGGIDQAIDDGVFVDFTPYLDTLLPNYKKYITENDTIWKEATTLQNRVATCYYLYNPEYPGKELEWWGQAVRQDMLDELGLEIPTSVDEWETVLLALKDAGVEVPYSMLTTSGMDAAFLAAYGIPIAPFTWRNEIGIYADEDGKVTYGAIESGYKDYLAMMNRWYSEGFLDPEFMTRSWMTSADTIYAMYGDGRIGAIYSLDGILPTMIATSEAVDSNAVTTACPVPSLVDGSGTPSVSIGKLYTSGHWFAVSSACKDPELAMAFLDYLCSDDGVMLTAFGIEGQSYTLQDDGSPMFTDVVMNCESGSSDGMRLNTACALTIRGMENIRNPIFKDDTIEEWDRVWTESVNEYQTIYELTADEESSAAAIMGDISTYVQEQTIKAITDANVLADWDNIVANIEGMGMQEALAIYQAGYDRYNNR